MSSEDTTIERITRMLVDALDEEPPADAGQHPSIEVHERVGAEWADWHKRVHGLRILLGHRLVNREVERVREQRRAAEPHPDEQPLWYDAENEVCS